MSNAVDEIVHPEGRKFYTAYLREKCPQGRR
jgi:hypothetical protein